MNKELISKISNGIKSEKKKQLYYYQLNYNIKKADTSKIQEKKPHSQFNDKDNFAFLFTHPIAHSQRSLIGMIKIIIDQAVKRNGYLLICSFIINNHEVIEFLLNASVKIPGKIYIIVGNQSSTFCSYNKQGDIFDKGLFSLANSGVLIRHMENAHLKFLTNGEQSLICTTNLTSEGLYKNPEFGLSFNTKDIALSLNRLFSYLWFERSCYRLINDSWEEIKTNNNQSIYYKHLLKSPGSITQRVICSSNQIIQEINQNDNILHNKSLFSVFLELLNSAEKRIDIAVYLFTSNSKSRLKKIKQSIINKVKKGIIVRIIVPAVKTNYSKIMNNTLNDLKEVGVKVRYYQELHGKCLIIDCKKALIFTGNIDKYLFEENSCDIGYKFEDPPIIANLILFYNHLWDEASEKCDSNTPINLHIDLVVNSYYKIANSPPISIKRLKELMDKCINIQFHWNKSGSLLTIKGKNNKILNLYIDLQDNQFIESSGSTINLLGIITEKTKMNKKNAIVNTVSRLELKLLWEQESFGFPEPKK